MAIAFIFLLIVTLLLGLYLFAIRGRAGHKELIKLRSYNYAHRGLHSEGIAENSMTAFRKAKENGYGIELDIHLLKDGNLAVIHDYTLARTTGKECEIENLTIEELKNYNLENTEDTIPTFEEVLKLYNGAAPLIVELKATKNNYAELSKKACEVLENYNGSYCLESFDPRCILWLKKNRPNIVRGQLCENYFKSKSKLNFLLKLFLSYNLFNFISKPDFIAYKFSQRKSVLANSICRKLWKMQMVGWTIRTADEHKIAKNENWISIFENFIP